MSDLRDLRNRNPSEYGYNSSPGSASFPLLGNDDDWERDHFPSPSPSDRPSSPVSLDNSPQPRFHLVPWNETDDAHSPETVPSHPPTPDNNDLFVSARGSPEPPSRPPTPVISRRPNLTSPGHHIDRQILRLEGLIRNFHEHLDIPYSDTPIEYLPSPFNQDAAKSATDLEHQLDHLHRLYQIVEERRNRPTSPVEPTNSQIRADYRIYRYRALYAINPRWAVIFAWRPAFFGLTLVHIGAALQLDNPDLFDNALHTVPITSRHIIDNVILTVSGRGSHLPARTSLYPPVTDLTFLPPNDPFASEHPLSLRLHYQRLATESHVAVTFASLEVIREGETLATFSYDARRNGEVFDALHDEIKLALCIYVIDPRIFHVFRRTKDLHFFPPFLGLDFA